MSAPVKAGMSDQTSSNIARDGAAKRPQTSFAVHPGMKSVTSYRGAAPTNPGDGPDAAPPDAMGGKPKIISTQFKASWGMRDANGQSVNGETGKKVLAEGVK